MFLIAEFVSNVLKSPHLALKCIALLKCEGVWSEKNLYFLSTILYAFSYKLVNFIQGLYFNENNSISNREIKRLFFFFFFYKHWKNLSKAKLRGVKRIQEH